MIMTIVRVTLRRDVNNVPARSSVKELRCLSRSNRSPDFFRFRLTRDRKDVPRNLELIW